MAKPLFTPEEHQEQKQKLDEHEKLRKKNDVPWDTYWAERQSIESAFQTETVKRAQARAGEYLSALLIMFGRRGSVYIEFSKVFTSSDHPDIQKVLKEVDTPEDRRGLHTILKALTEIPRTWATSAFLRFLRGTGKQQGAKYHGAGFFGTRYGWKETELKNICEVVTSERHPYSKVLMSYVDTEKSAADDPDFERSESGDPRFFTRVERDVPFLNKLCEMLEARGLATLPEPEPVKEKKPHKLKVFKPGDIIRQGNLRDLPLPAHVEIPIERQADETKNRDKWESGTMEHVVTKFFANGYYECFIVGKDRTTAFASTDCLGQDSKDWLYGAKYLGPWGGKLDKNRKLSPKFRYRKPGSKW